MQLRRLQTKSDMGDLFARDVHDDEILRVSGAEFAVAVALREIGGHAQLMGRDTAAENGGSDIKEAGLFLPMYTNVVAEEVPGRGLRDSRRELVAKLVFDGR